MQVSEELEAKVIAIGERIARDYERNAFDALADLVFWAAAEAYAQRWMWMCGGHVFIGEARAMVLGDVARQGWWPRYVRVATQNNWFPRWRTMNWKVWEWHLDDKDQEEET